MSTLPDPKDYAKEYVKGSTAAHQALGKKFFKAVSRQLPFVIMLPYTVGMFRDFESAERVVHAGQKGVPDWLVILPDASVIFFDTKTGSAGYNLNQKNFKNRMYEATNQERVFKCHNVDYALDIIRWYGNGIVGNDK